MQELKLEVGKTYVNNQEEEVKITRSAKDQYNSSIFFGNGGCYFEDGLDYGLEEGCNLIKEVAKDSSKLKSRTKLYRSNSSTLSVTSGDNVVTIRDSIGSLGYTEDEVEAILTDTQNGYICKFPSFNSVSQDYYVCLDYAQAEYLYLVLKEALGKNVKRVKE